MELDLASIFKKPANIVVPVLLFILLTPGLYITLPDPQSSLFVKTLTHAAVFAAVYILLRIVFTTYY